MTTLREKIAEKMKTPTLTAFATVTETGTPWVRYVVAWADENLTIWFATFNGSRKVAQIEKNSEVHLTAGVTDLETAESYLQIQGRAEIFNDATTREAVWYDHLSNIFSGPDDPMYRVCRVMPYRIEFNTMVPGEPPEVWEA